MFPSCQSKEEIPTPIHNSCPAGDFNESSEAFGFLIRDPQLFPGDAQRNQAQRAWVTLTALTFQNNPEKTTASERGDFYITGDRAHKDEDGYFWFLGRNDDVINSSRSHCLLFPSPLMIPVGGREGIRHSLGSLLFFFSYRIGPVEVESALAEHPAVLESAVVSSPDPIRGEVTGTFCQHPNLLLLTSPTSAEQTGGKHSFPISLPRFQVPRSLRHFSSG